MTDLEKKVNNTLKRLEVGNYYFKNTSSINKSGKFTIDFRIERLNHNSPLTYYLVSINGNAPTDYVYINIIDDKSENLIYEKILTASEFHRGIVICTDELYTKALSIYNYLSHNYIDKSLTLLITLNEFEMIVNFEKEKRDRIAKTRNMFRKN